MPGAEGVAVNFLPDFKLAAPKYFRVVRPDSIRTLGINPPIAVQELPCGAPVRGAGSTTPASAVGKRRCHEDRCDLEAFCWQ